MNTQTKYNQNIKTFEDLILLEDEITEAFHGKKIDLYDWELIHDNAMRELSRIRKEELLNRNSLSAEKPLECDDGHNLRYKGIKKKT